MSAETHALERPRDAAPEAASRGTPAWRSRRWAIVGALSVTETVSWGILYYAFAVFLVPMRDELHVSTAQLAGAFSLGIAVSAVAGIAVGRHLDHHGPRRLMTAGSLAGVTLVVAWSRVDSVAAVYAVWGAMGAVMATVLYEPAFTVLAKHFARPAERRRAMTAMTLVAALASFVFLPLSQALIDAYGWRDALLALAGLLAIVTVPLHALVLRPAHRTVSPGTAGTGAAPAPAVSDRELEAGGSVSASEALRSAPFWLLSSAFFLVSLAAIAMTIHTIPFLLGRGYDAGFAALAVGLVGISQIPGRLLFEPLARCLPRAAATASLFVLVGTGIAVVVGIHATWMVVLGLVLLGMGNGMATLARATSIADLYGAAAYGTIGSVAAASTTVARAGGPVLAALYATAAGFESLLWTLAFLAVVAAGLAFWAETAAGSLRRAAVGRACAGTDP